MATIGSIGDELNLLIKQGSTFKSYDIELQNNDRTPFDLTSCTLRGHIRREPGDITPVAVIEFIYVDRPAGKFYFTLSKEVTTLIPAGQTVKSKESQYVWDCELEDALGTVTPLYYGSAKVFREVTHD